MLKAETVHANALAALREHDQEVERLSLKRAELVAAAEQKATKVREWQRWLAEAESSRVSASVSRRPLETLRKVEVSLDGAVSREEMVGLLQTLRSQLENPELPFASADLPADFADAGADDEGMDLDRATVGEASLASAPAGVTAASAGVDCKRARESVQMLVEALSDEQMASAGVSREALVQRLLEGEDSEAASLFKKLRRL